MPEQRVTWSGRSTTAEFGSVGDTELFAISGGHYQTLHTLIPGMTSRSLDSDSEGELKRAAEEWLSEFVSSLGAVFPEEAARERPGDWQALRDWLGRAVRFKASQTPGEINDAVRSGLEIALAKMREMEADR